MSSDEEFVETEVNMADKFFIGGNNIEMYVTGDNFDEWIERVNIVLKINKVKEEEKTDYMISLAGGDLYKVIKSLVSPQKIEDVKYDDLVKLLSKNFKPTRSIIAKRFKFYKRLQAEDEFVNDYAFQLKALSRECDFGDFLKDTLRDIFVCGIRNEFIQKKLLKEPKLDFEKAVDIATNMELTGRGMKDLKPNTGAESPMTINERRASDYRNSLEPIRDRSSSRSNYENNGKRRVESPSPTRVYKNTWTCFKCGKPGHIARYCREKVHRKEEMLSNRSEDLSSRRIDYVELEEPMMVNLKVSKINVKLDFKGDIKGYFTF